MVVGLLFPLPQTGDGGCLLLACPGAIACLARAGSPLLPPLAVPLIHLEVRAPITTSSELAHWSNGHVLQ